MLKSDRLRVEAAARAAVGQHFGCEPQSQRVSFPNNGPVHEFDVYTPGIVIGGVSTSPLTTGGGSRNTGGCDRACSEILWLTLWPGTETRIHGLTDKPLADWLVKRYHGAAFPHDITIYHYGINSGALARISTLGA